MYKYGNPCANFQIFTKIGNFAPIVGENKDYPPGEKSMTV